MDTDDADRATMNEGAVRAGAGRYFFELDALAGIDAAPSYSSAHGPVIEGDRLQVGLMGLPAEASSTAHTHPNEQFTYLLEGTYRSEIAGTTRTLSAGSIFYVPPNAVHRGEVVGDDPVRFVVVKDRRHGLAGTPLDEGDSRPTPATSTEGSQETKTDGAIRAGDGAYHFELDGLDPVEAAPEYSTAHGPVIEGERSLVGVIRLPAGTGGDLHTHPNEQFSYVLQGTNHSIVDGQRAAVTPGMLRYVPASTEHAGHAGDEADSIAFVAKDRRHGIDGTAVERSGDDA